MKRFFLLFVLLGALTCATHGQKISESSARFLPADQHLEVARRTLSEIESGSIRATAYDHVRALCMVSEALVRTANLKDAEDAVDRAESEVGNLPLAIQPSAKTRIGLVRAQIYEADGKGDEAIGTLVEMLDSPDTPEEALTTIRFGIITSLQRTRQYPAAQKFLDSWAKLPGMPDNQMFLIWNYNNQMFLGKWVEARDSAKSFLSKCDTDLKKSLAHVLIASAASKQGGYLEANEELRLADKMMSALPSSSVEIISVKSQWLQVALTTAILEKDYNRAEKLFAEKGGEGDRSLSWLMFVVKADLGKLSEAEAFAKKYLLMLESDPQFQDLSAQARTHYALAGIYMQQKDLEQAHKHLAFGLDCEVSNYGELSSSGIGDSIYLRDSLIKADPVSLAASLGDPLLIEKALSATQGFVYSKLQKQNAFASQPVKGSERLLNGETLLAVFEFSDWSLPVKKGFPPEKLIGALVLKKGTLPVFVKLGPVLPVADSLNKFYAALATESSESEDGLITALSDLYEKICGPLVARDLLSGVVLYSGDGLFASLPIHLLWHDGKFQIEERSVAYLPFFRVLDRNGRKYSSAASVIIGDATYSADDALPAAGTECAEVAKCWKDANVKTLTPLTGEKANASNFLRIKSPAFLHVVAHGASKWIVEDKWPDPLERIHQQLSSSCLILSKSKDGNGKWGNDQYDLITGENMIDCDLSGTRCVVLHACRSGVGVPAVREGNIGLLTALLSTGPHRAILSSWNIIDESAPALSACLYKEAILQFDGKKDIQIFSEFQRSSLSDMKQNQSVWKAVRSSGALCLYLGCR